jgi:lipopolysaccharide transport system permease protein
LANGKFLPKNRTSGATLSLGKYFVGAITKIMPAGTLIIKPSRGWVALDLRALWGYRELLYFLTWRDIKVRYKQTVLGIAWAIIQPLFLMVAFSIFFGRLAKVPSDGLPYPVFTFCALIPWQLFAHSFTQASHSLVENDRLITKVYFPRLVIPLSAVLAGLVDFVIGFIILLALMFYYGISPSGALWTIPVFVLLAGVSALAVGLWLSALNVRYRDVRYTIPFITQFWFFVSPIAYPSSIVPESWRWFYALNPMVGVIEGFRWALLGKAEAPGSELIVSSAVVVILFICGLYYFRRMERTFADVV